MVFRTVIASFVCSVGVVARRTKSLEGGGVEMWCGKMIVKILECGGQQQKRIDQSDTLLLWISPFWFDFPR